jgi:RNA polymerase sigma-70 factor (ECF subfamily)
MDYTTHATLLTRLADSLDPAAWREFHGRYADLLRGFARRRGLQPADCDDVTQNVLLSLTRSMGKFSYDPARGKFRAYLKTLALHEIFRFLRQRSRQRALGSLDEEAGRAAADPAVEAQWEEEWRQYHLRRAMARLENEFSERDRMAFAQYAVEGRPVADTAAALGMSADQVYQAKSRILKRLGGMIAEQVEDEG